MEGLRLTIAAPRRDDAALDQLAEDLRAALQTDAGIATEKARRPGSTATLSGAELIFGQLLASGVAAAAGKLVAEGMVSTVKAWLESRRASEATVEISPTNRPEPKVRLTSKSLTKEQLAQTVADISAMLEKIR